jgi:hypothetical protein
MKALVHENIVVDLVETEFEVHESAAWMDAPEGCKTGWVLVNGSLVAPEPAPELSYDAQRMAEYPAIGEQLDMLWHAIDGGALDQTSDFYTTIAAIKAQYPKPE